MRDAQAAPRLHLLVCANRRESTNPLGAGCGARGEAVYDELKREVASRRAYADIWVTKTYCLGTCPKLGATVAVYPSGRVLADVDVTDVAALLAF